MKLLNLMIIITLVALFSIWAYTSNSTTVYEVEYGTEIVCEGDSELDDNGAYFAGWRMVDIERRQFDNKADALFFARYVELVEGKVNVSVVRVWNKTTIRRWW